MIALKAKQILLYPFWLMACSMPSMSMNLHTGQRRFGGAMWNASSLSLASAGYSLRRCIFCQIDTYGVHTKCKWTRVELILRLTSHTLLNEKRCVSFYLNSAVQCLPWIMSLVRIDVRRSLGMFPSGISTCNRFFRHCDKTFTTQGHRFECLLRHYSA